MTRRGHRPEKKLTWNVRQGYGQQDGQVGRFQGRDDLVRDVARLRSIVIREYKAGGSHGPFKQAISPDSTSWTIWTRGGATGDSSRIAIAI